MELIVREPYRRAPIKRGLFVAWLLVLLKLNQWFTKKYDRQSGCLPAIWEKALSA
jgi:hypothetical protein